MTSMSDGEEGPDVDVTVVAVHPDVLVVGAAEKNLDDRDGQGDPDLVFVGLRVRDQDLEPLRILAGLVSRVFLDGLFDSLKVILFFGLHDRDRETAQEQHGQCPNSEFFHACLLEFIRSKF